MRTHDVIATLRRRGITLLATADGKLRVEGVELLTETEKVTLKAHKPAILQALRQSTEPVNARQSETASRAPLLNEHPGAMATGVKYGLYTPNCNRCRRYRWRSASCQRQGPVEFANTPPCGGNDYQPFAPTLAERESLASATGENVS
ncbi:MAG TPA: hypothetical protein VES89_02605 [Candidatus Competibacteraceae bacterium]|nr:hypothetical protein [Candidatus Competibacteraceae bacterium]